MKSVVAQFNAAQLISQRAQVSKMIRFLSARGERQKRRETDRQTDRQTDSLTDRQTEIEKDREIGRRESKERRGPHELVLLQSLLFSSFSSVDHIVGTISHNARESFGLSLMR